MRVYSKIQLPLILYLGGGGGVGEGGERGERGEGCDGLSFPSPLTPLHWRGGEGEEGEGCDSLSFLFSINVPSNTWRSVLLETKWRGELILRPQDRITCMSRAAVRRLNGRGRRSSGKRD